MSLSYGASTKTCSKCVLFPSKDTLIRETMFVERHCVAFVCDTKRSNNQIYEIVLLNVYHIRRYVMYASGFSLCEKVASELNYCCFFEYVYRKLAFLSI